MEFDVIFKMVKVCLYVVLAVVEVLTGKKSDNDDF